MAEHYFIGREREAAALHRSLVGSQAALIVVYGRRRVGKSTLLHQALRQVEAVYYQATRVTDIDNQELFKKAVTHVTGADPIFAGLQGWEALLRYLSQLATQRPRGLSVVLDEFPYLCESNAALPSIVQKIWDEVRARNVPLRLVLCGSRISFMKTLLAERNPLHGRQSMELVIEPLTYRQAAQFVPGWSVEDRLRLFAVFGGAPYYLSLVDPDATLASNVQRLLLEEGAPLREEPTHLLQAELKEIARYSSILRAIANGCTQLKDIAGRVLKQEESGSSLTSYLTTLQGLRLVHAASSLDAASGRQRNTRYYLDDPFLAFHYHFVLPNLSALQAGHGRAVYTQAIARQLDEYVSRWFEVICRQWLRCYGQERLRAVARDVGRIWAADYDIDVAGRLLDGRTVAGECKWTREPPGVRLLHELRQRAALNAFYTNEGGKTLFLIFSRSAPTAELRRAAAADRNILFMRPTQLLGPRQFGRGRSRRRHGHP